VCVIERRCGRGPGWTGTRRWAVPGSAVAGFCQLRTWVGAGNDIGAGATNAALLMTQGIAGELGVRRTRCLNFFICYSPIRYTHPFNGPFSGTTWVSWYQKGKNNLDFTEARDSEWQWHQLGHMQICTRCRQITMPAPHHSVFYRPDALSAAQPTASKH